MFVEICVFRCDLNDNNLGHTLGANDPQGAQCGPIMVHEFLQHYSDPDRHQTQIFSFTAHAELYNKLILCFIRTTDLDSNLTH